MRIRIGGLKVGGCGLVLRSAVYSFLKIAERLGYGNLSADV
jgi:hypothetical protein